MSSNIDLTKVPLAALKKPTLHVLSSGLNSLKVIPNADGLPRDWRGIAHLLGLSSTETSQISSTHDPFLTLLNHYGVKTNVYSLQEYLIVIDRHDVLVDVEQLIERDGIQYLDHVDSVNVPTSSISIEADNLILTTDDVVLVEKGLQPQIYDAYVLYAEEDIDFATEIIHTMENDYNLKFCIRDRDLIGGVTFEHEAIMKLIAERCKRLIVIVSPSFLKSKANKFFVTFAQALGIDQRQRKVIPILYQSCDLPPELSYYFLLDYNRAGKLWNFWDKLRDSIQAPDISTNSTQMRRSPLPPQKITTPTPNQNQTPSSSTTEVVESSAKSKKSNVYKIFKNSFTKMKTSSSDVTEKKLKENQSSSLFNNLTSLMSSDNVPFENFENSNSSSFETKDKNPKSDSTKKVKKKRWFKRKNVEPLLM